MQDRVRPLGTFTGADNWQRIVPGTERQYPGSTENATQVLVRNNSSESIQLGFWVMNKGITRLGPKQEVLLDVREGTFLKLQRMGLSSASNRQEAAFYSQKDPAVVDIGVELRGFRPAPGGGAHSSPGGNSNGDLLMTTGARLREAFANWESMDLNELRRLGRMPSTAAQEQEIVRRIEGTANAGPAQGGAPFKLVHQ